VRKFFTPRRFAIGASLGLVIALVYVANFGIWMNRSLVDADEFVDSAVVAFEMESSRAAISSLVVDRLVEDRPVVAIASPLLEDVVADLLDGDRLESALRAVGLGLHDVLFDGSQDGIVVDLSPVGESVLPSLERFFPAIAEEIPEVFFGEVVIVEPGTVPELSPYADAIRKLVWLSIVLSIVLMGVIVKVVQSKWKAIAAIGGAITIAGLLTVVLVNRARSLTISLPRNADVEVLIINLYDQTAGALRTQGWWITGIGLALLVIGFGLRDSRTEDSPELASSTA